MKIFSNTKKLTEYKTSFEYENISLNIIKFSLSMKVSLWILKFFFEYKTEAVSRRHSIRKVFLEIPKIHRKTPVPEPATLIKKRLWHRCFLVNFGKFLRTPVFYRTPPAAASHKNMNFAPNEQPWQPGARRRDYVKSL